MIMDRIFKPLDDVLNHITMYRLVLYYCLALLLGDFGLGLAGLSPHDPAQLVFSTVIICSVAWAANKLLCLVLQIPANAESVWITGLILALIMPPAQPGDWHAIAGLSLAALAGIAGKFALGAHAILHAAHQRIDGVAHLRHVA